MKPFIGCMCFGRSGKEPEVCLEEPKVPAYFRGTAGAVCAPLQERSPGLLGRDEDPRSSGRDGWASPGEGPLGATEKLLGYLRSIIYR